MAVVDDETLAGIADELYALDPAEFTAARNARAKSAEGELAAGIRALKKPSAAAALTNRLTREDRAGLRSLVALGRDIRQAQDDGDRDRLVALGARRRERIAALTSALGRGAAADEVAETLQAAVFDENAAAAVLSGRLVRALAPGRDLPADAVAVPEAVVPMAAPKPRTRGESATLTREAERAEQRAAELAAAQAAAEKTVAEARAELKRVAAELERNERAARAARAERETAAEVLARAEAEAGTHRDEARAARADAVRARRRADSR